MENHTFTHTPRAPRILEGFEELRYFARQGGAAGLHLGIIRHEEDDTAEVCVATWGVPEVRSSVMAKMTADQCEAAARAFIDAAHDLRTHNSLTALHNAIVAAEGAAS